MCPYALLLSIRSQVLILCEQSGFRHRFTLTVLPERCRVYTTANDTLPHWGHDIPGRSEVSIGDSDSHPRHARTRTRGESETFTADNRTR